ncbi:MAG: hypothetical protein KDK89_18680, partial [Alphaproteobacteria bacterium]|nr:hypothetical protein [Alphaproteobacteria bacterium]
MTTIREPSRQATGARTVDPMSPQVRRNHRDIQLFDGTAHACLIILHIALFFIERICVISRHAVQVIDFVCVQNWHSPCLLSCHQREAVFRHEKNRSHHQALQ